VGRSIGGASAAGGSATGARRCDAESRRHVFGQTRHSTARSAHAREDYNDRGIVDGDGLAGYDGVGGSQRHRGCQCIDGTERMEDRALSASVNWLLERQAPAGWWTDELETNVTMTAEHVLLLRFLGVPIDPI